MEIEKDGRSRYAIRDIIRSLQTKLISFDYYDDELKENRRYETQWLQAADYNRDFDEVTGKIRIRFDNKLQPHLLELRKNFTKYHLATVLKFRSKYSVRLYELLKQYEYLGSRIIEYSKLRLMLGLDEYDNPRKD